MVRQQSCHAVSDSRRQPDILAPDEKASYPADICPTPEPQAAQHFSIEKSQRGYPGLITFFVMDRLVQFGTVLGASSRDSIAYLDR
jgi:hypothetical protein